MAIQSIRRVLHMGEKGQGMTEYIIIVALISIAAIGIYSLFGQQIRQVIASIGGQLAGDTGTTTETVQLGGQAGKKATLKDFGGNN